MHQFSFPFRFRSPFSALRRLHLDSLRTWRSIFTLVPSAPALRRVPPSSVFPEPQGVRKGKEISVSGISPFGVMISFGLFAPPGFPLVFEIRRFSTDTREKRGKKTENGNANGREKEARARKRWRERETIWMKEDKRIRACNDRN